jgi:acyl-CoA dehydrogenase
LNIQALQAQSAVKADRIRSAADAVAAVAAAHAVAVDRDSRFPAEALAAAKEHRLLGIQVPQRLGGEGADLSRLLQVAYTLGRACASTGMVFSMHQIKVACILRHARGSTWHESMLRRLCSEQLLLASSTTEGTGGGNVRASEAPIELQGERIRLERRATVISYGAEADGIVTTARRTAESPASDQVLVVFLKSDYTLEPLVGWDTLGMRGTSSTGFILRAIGVPEQILADRYEKIHAETMVPFAHLLWSSVWAGIAANALERAQLFLRHVSRQSGGQLPPGASHFTQGSVELRTLRALIGSSCRAFEQIEDDERRIRDGEFQMAIQAHKVQASEMAVSIVLSALRACGLSGYRNDGDFSVARNLRDVLSAPIMINNDRILGNLVTTSLMTAVPALLLETP